MYGHLVYFISKVLAWEISNMKWGFAKKVIIKSQRQFMYGSNIYGSDVTLTLSMKLLNQSLFSDFINTFIIDLLLMNSHSLCAFKAQLGSNPFWSSILVYMHPALSIFVLNWLLYKYLVKIQVDENKNSPLDNILPHCVRHRRQGFLNINRRVVVPGDLLIHLANVSSMAMAKL